MTQNNRIRSISDLFVDYESEPETKTKKQYLPNNELKKIANWNDLPETVLRKILFDGNFNFSQNKLQKCSLVCKKWNNIINKDSRTRFERFYLTNNGKITITLLFLYNRMMRFLRANTIEKSKPFDYLNINFIVKKDSEYCESANIVIEPTWKECYFDLNTTSFSTIGLETFNKVSGLNSVDTTEPVNFIQTIQIISKDIKKIEIYSTSNIKNESIRHFLSFFNINEENRSYIINSDGVVNWLSEPRIFDAVFKTIEEYNNTNVFW